MSAASRSRWPAPWSSAWRMVVPRSANLNGQVDDDGFRQGGCERLTQGSAGVVGPDRRQVEPRHRGMRLARLVSFQNGDARAAFEGEMRAGDVDWRIHIYGGVQHSFTH